MTDLPSPPGLPSPCVGRCALDASGQTCSGCRRTIAEITAWSTLDDAGKAAVWARLRGLQAPAARAKTCSRCGSGFGCGTGGKDGGCWCADLPPAMPWPPADDCLCPDCLRAAIVDRAAQLGRTGDLP
ncbi:DUF1289 domain-containing protein [Jeongeupia naejangsanensis]|uniref:DUF1289 domain-containing protein n=1 Tax=Jeongeupia naejangsanensis TaxID=613195 RepID=A0ABS2BJL7_9NEIS|nr:DUF1289 domain-containing protein [Jeongeupia naejangsanensis]MBM3115796.1 DUF1289 domain-containing protein [Jeongeupia naejangsanensis]